jgi:methylmalonyl-CoA/ethylmalonyl-CoA epimerase
MPGTKRETGTKPARAPKSLPAKAATAPSKKTASTAARSAKAPPAHVKAKPAKATAKAAPTSPTKAKPAAKAPPLPARASKAKPPAAPPRPEAKPAARKLAATPPPKPGAPQAAKSKAAATQSSIDVAFALSKLHQVALLATDLDRSIAFYRDVLGLSYMDRYDPPGLAFFHLGGGTRLILSATSSKATLYFKVDDIDSAVSALAARGVFFLHRPSMIHRDDKGRLGKKGVEEWMAFFKDPSDNVLALVAQRVG